jgi:hypothetical protein
MPTTKLSGIPLFGALCIDAGLISPAQLAHCLELQVHQYPGTPIGRIMVLQGYCTEPNIARIVAQQQAFRREFCKAIEQASPLASAAEPATPVRADESFSALPELGAFAASELDNSYIFSARA